MNNLLKYLNTFGIPVDSSTPIEVLLAAYYLVTLILILFNVLNIIMYLISIYIVSHEKFLNKIPKEYVYTHKLIIFYKNIRVGYIIFEAVLLIFLLSVLILVSYGIVSFYLENI